MMSVLALLSMLFAFAALVLLVLWLFQLRDMREVGRLSRQIQSAAGVSRLPCQPSAMRMVRFSAASELPPIHRGIGLTGCGSIVMSRIVANAAMGNFGWQLMVPTKSTLDVNHNNVASIPLRLL